nr:VPg [Cyrtanthus elatus virus A]
GKRERQKLKFQRERSEKMNRGVFDDCEDNHDNFAKEYLKKKKSKGRSGGSDTKARRFVHMYGFDPQEYSIVKFLDPLTGIVYDQNDFKSTWELSDKIVKDRFDDDDLERELLRYRPEIHAYYFKHGSHKAIKIDMTPHNATKVGKVSGRAVGFPSRQGEFRQTGEHVEVDVSNIDERVTSQLVDFE